MITKNDIKIALNKYDSERSVWKVGMFGAAVDYVTTPFYYDLKNFYNNTLKNHPENEELLPAHIKYLQKMLKADEVGPNSTNSAIVDLYDSMRNLVNTKSEIAEYR